MRIAPGKLKGTVPAIPAKAHAHRLLIGAALADKATVIHCPAPSEDILRTAQCLDALCAHVERTEEGFVVTPRASSQTPLLEVGESGSTYRFLLPVACALGVNPRFSLAGRLPSRPMDELLDELEQHGMAFSGKGSALPLPEKAMPCCSNSSSSSSMGRLGRRPARENRGFTPRAQATGSKNR